MDLRPLSETYQVTPQPTPGDIATLAAQGVRLVICNRPDTEVPVDLQAGAMQAAADAAGIGFVYNPVNGAAMTMDNVKEQAAALEATEGPVVGYCATGMRAVMMWAFVKSGQIDTDAIIAAGNAAGFPLDGMRGRIDAMAADTD
jgi:uncharacterized protein (TIGR01244 family)